MFLHGEESSTFHRSSIMSVAWMVNTSFLIHSVFKYSCGWESADDKSSVRTVFKMMATVVKFRLWHNDPTCC